MNRIIVTVEFTAAPKPCPICGKEYTEGYDGRAGACDKCLGTKFDWRGWPWLPDENEKTVNGVVYTREEAFK